MTWFEGGSLVELCHQEHSPVSRDLMHHVLSTVSFSSILRIKKLTWVSIALHIHSSQLSKGMFSPTTNIRLFAHLTLSPNTCPSYIQGQDRPPSVTECEVSKSPITYHLTTSQAFSKYLDDDADRQLRPACFQFHHPGSRSVPLPSSFLIASPYL